MVREYRELFIIAQSETNIPTNSELQSVQN